MCHPRAPHFSPWCAEGYSKRPPLWPGLPQRNCLLCLSVCLSGQWDSCVAFPGWRLPWGPSEPYRGKPKSVSLWPLCPVSPCQESRPRNLAEAHSPVSSQTTWAMMVLQCSGWLSSEMLMGSLCIPSQGLPLTPAPSPSLSPPGTHSTPVTPTPGSLPGWPKVTR